MARVPATNLPTLLQALYHERYTGQTVVHWQDGIPRLVEIVNKRRVDLTGGPPEPILQEAHGR